MCPELNFGISQILKVPRSYFMHMCSQINADPKKKGK